MDGLARTRVLLKGVLKGLARAGWPRHRVHLFGFSQGGTAALDLAMHSRRASCTGRHILNDSSRRCRQGGTSTLDLAMHSRRAPMCRVRMWCAASSNRVPRIC